MDTSNLSTGSSTVSVIWSWRWLVAETAADVSEDENIELKLEKEGLGDICSDPEEDTDIRTHSVVFKCIGSVKSKGYQVALEKARNLMSDGQIVPVRLVHEHYNPRALAFVCDINSKPHTVGYIVNELLDEVHTAINQNCILSVKFATLQNGPSQVQAFSLGYLLQRKGLGQSMQ